MTFSWSQPHFSLAPFVVAVALLAWYFEAVGHRSAGVSKRQKVLFAVGVAVLLVATTWPLEELAHSTSLAALVVQRELLVLVVAPLLLSGISPEMGARLTRPACIDWLAMRLSEPVPALVLTTLLLGVTAMPFTVSASSSDVFLRALVDAGTLAAGVVLWNPVVRRVPGVRELTPVGMAGYLLAQSLAPTFLSFAWILAPHPLYPSLTGQHAALGISPIFDQRMSGYLAKLGTFGVLWPVAFRYFARAIDGSAPTSPVLQWSDVERHLERASRQERKGRSDEVSHSGRL